MKLDFPDCVKRDFPDEFAFAWPVIDEILDGMRDADLTPLEEHSPALKGNDWGNYLKCSVARVTRAMRALSKKGIRSGRLLDFGSYFGNFSLPFAKAGFDVTAADAYARYKPAFAGIIKLMTGNGITIVDSESPSCFEKKASYDVILLMSVIEHIPHTPKDFMESINAMLKPGGVLVLDTPNLAYIYNRQRLCSGKTIFPPLESQYYTKAPYEGHHREYTIGEIKWLLKAIGHSEIDIETFNYSLYGLDEIEGDDYLAYTQMENDPNCREIILSVSINKPADIPGEGKKKRANAVHDEGEALIGLQDMEAFDPRNRVIAEAKKLADDLQNEINLRDGMLQNYQVQYDGIIRDLQNGINLRDEMLQKSQAQYDEAVTTRDGIINDLQNGVNLRDEMLRKSQAQYEEAVAARDGIINDLQNGVNLRDEMLRKSQAQYDEAVATRDGIINDLQNGVNLRDKMLRKSQAQYDEAVATRDGIINDLQNGVNLRDEMLRKSQAQYEEAVATRDGIINDLQNGVNLRDDMLRKSQAQYDEAVATRDGIINDLQNGVNLRDEMLRKSQAQYDEAVAARDGIINDLQNGVNLRDEMLQKTQAQLDEAVATRDGIINDLQNGVNLRDEMLQKYDAKLNETTAELQKTIESLNSKSALLEQRLVKLAVALNARLRTAYRSTKKLIGE